MFCFAEFLCKIEQFHVTGLFLWPLKRSENQMFAGIFKGV